MVFSSSSGSIVGLLVTCLFCFGCVGLGRLLIGSSLSSLDPAAAVGLSGLIGLGSIGTITLLIGVLPQGLTWGLALLSLIVAVGVVLEVRQLSSWSIRSVSASSTTYFLPILFLICLALVGVLAPSDTMDWDSLAYHLAVPKLYLQAGQIYPISFIHHSNFPSCFDNLYIFGLWYGGQAGAKAFSLCTLCLGLVAIYGTARDLYGARAAWPATLAFACIPVVAWESGTAYIDVAHGLFSGLAAVLVLTRLGDSRVILPAGLLLGFSAGSKYTGLISIFLALSVALYVTRNLRWVAKLALVSCLVAGPWYVKNIAVTGNPVYPFLYSRLGGTNWSQFSADIYNEEQKSFGNAPSVHSVGASVLGMATTPGKFANPNPAAGTGFPLYSIGGLVLASTGLFGILRKNTRADRSLLLWIGLWFAVWLVLSQQSRYVLSFAVPMALFAGALAAEKKTASLILTLVFGQFLYTSWMIKEQRTDIQLQEISRSGTPASSFYEPSRAINVLGKGRAIKVALYDEVFGFFLDVPYFWANPGHSTEIPYPRLSSGAELAAFFKGFGITHVYLNLGAPGPEKDRFLQACSEKPFTAAETEGAFQDLRSKWKVLVADAIQKGNFRLVQSFPSSALFEVTP